MNSVLSDQWAQFSAPLVAQDIVALASDQRINGTFDRSNLAAHVRSLKIELAQRGDHVREEAIQCRAEPWLFSSFGDLHL